MATTTSPTPTTTPATPTFTTTTTTTTDSPIQDKKAKRTKVLNEIVSTEKTYVTCLSLLLSRFMPSLIKFAAENDSQLIGVHDKAQKVFFWLKNISEIHTRVLFEMSEWNTQEDSCIPAISELFLSSLSTFNSYEGLVMLHGEFLEWISLLVASNGKFAEYVKRCESPQKDYVGWGGFQSLLITPIQRLPRYVLLLEELNKLTTDEGHKKSLKKVTSKLEKLCHSFEVKKEEVDAARTMNLLVQRVAPCPATLDVGLLAPSRRASLILNKKKDSTSHKWKSKAFQYPVWCTVCNSIAKQAGSNTFRLSQCSTCLGIVHKNCEAQSFQKCPGRPALIDFEKKHLLQQSGNQKGITYISIVPNLTRHAQQAVFCRLYCLSDALLIMPYDGVNDQPWAEKPKLVRPLACIEWKFGNREAKLVVVDGSHSLSIIPPREEDLIHQISFPSDFFCTYWAEFLSEIVEKGGENSSQNLTKSTSSSSIVEGDYGYTDCDQDGDANFEEEELDDEYCFSDTEVDDQEREEGERGERGEGDGEGELGRGDDSENLEGFEGIDDHHYDEAMVRWEGSVPFPNGHESIVEFLKDDANWEI